MDPVKYMCEQNKIPDGVRIKNLQKALVAEGYNHNVMKLAMIKVEMAVVTDVPKPLQEATHTLEGDGLLALIITDIINRTALPITKLYPAESGLWTTQMYEGL